MHVSGAPVIVRVIMGHVIGGAGGQATNGHEGEEKGRDPIHGEDD
jgi:hypothetical protein